MLSMNFTARFLGTPIVALVASLLCCPGAFSADQSPDETAIRNLQIRQQEAWNHHDAKAYASLFSQDADVVNVVGWWWKSRSELESKLARAYAFLFRDSTLTITDVQIKFPAANFAVAHVSWTMLGAKSPDLRRTGEACGLCESRVRRRIGRSEAPGRLRQGRSQPGKNQERIAHLPARFVRRDTQIAGCHRLAKHVRSHRGPVCRPEHAPWPGYRGHLAQRRSLWPDDASSAAERHRPARQPLQSAESERHLLRFCGISLVCTEPYICTSLYVYIQE